MSFYKIGETINFNPEVDVLTSKEALGDEKIALRFIKLAKTLKRLAPKADEFLYGHCIMMHSAEAALVNQETGEPILNKSGKPVIGNFEEFKLKNGTDSVRWVSSDNIKPYKNANGDIFSESELLKAYKKWIGKPLCKDHKSDSVDGIRGIIIDTYYDPKFKRVHALFALDRKNYGDLARKVETGYATAVSMGTAVGRSVCTECGNVAHTEREYCSCVKAKKNYGEINLDLSPIELSLVVNGADGLAKVRQIIASMNSYVQEKQGRLEEMQAQKCVNPAELQSLADAVSDMQKKISGLLNIEKTAAGEADLGELVAALKALQDDPDSEPEVEKIKEKIRELLDMGMTHIHTEEEPESPKAMPATMGGGEGYAMQNNELQQAPSWSFDPSRRLAYIKREGKEQDALVNEICLLRTKIDKMDKSLKEFSKEENNMNSARLRARAKARRAYWLGGGGVNEPTPGKPKYEKEDAESIREKEDKQMVGEPLETGSEGLHPGDEEIKKKLLRAEETELGMKKLSEDELKDRAMKRRAYWLGGGGLNEPTPGKPKYPKEDAESIREKEDKHMTGLYDMGGTDGEVPGDMETKKRLLRASLKAVFTKVANEKGELNKRASHWDIFAGNDKVLSATGDEIYGDELDDNWEYLNSKEYGKDVLSMIRTEGFDRVAYFLKGAQPPAAPAPGPVDPMAAMAPPALAPAPEVGAPPAGDKVEVKKEKGELQGKVEAALNEMESKIAEIREAVAGSSDEELVDIDVNIEGGKKEEGAPEAPAAPAPMEGVLASLDEAADELALISEALKSTASLDERNAATMVKAAEQALDDGETILAEAEMVLESAKKGKKGKKDKKEKKVKKEKKEDKKEEKEEKKEEPKKEEVKEEKKEAQALLDSALKLRAQNRAAMLARAMGELDFALTPEDEASLKKLLEEEKTEVAPSGEKMHPQLAKDKDEDEEDEEDEDEEDDEKEEKKSKKEKDKEEDDAMPAETGEMMLETPLVVEEAPGTVLSARKAERDQLVAQAAEKILGKYELDLGPAQNATEPTFFEAHPGGKGTVTELTHTKTPEAKVETISEIHDVMRDVAESGPRNVRDAAEKLNEYIVKGAVKVEDLERLVAEGKVDSACASYWKKYFGQAPEAKEFNSALSKALSIDFEKKKSQADDKGFRMKLRRAYGIGLQAQDKGLIGATREALETYVDEITKFDDAAFESTKRVVANYKTRSHGKMPQVGTDGNTEAMTVTASTDSVPAPDMLGQLNVLGWK